MLVILIIAIAVSKNNSKKPDSNLSAATLSESPLASIITSFDFGRISMAKGDVSKTFLLKNESKLPIIVKKVYTSCMCTSAIMKTAVKKFGPFGMPSHGLAPSLNIPLAPGEEFQVEAIFNPAAHGPSGIGPIERSVIIESDGFTSKELVIKALVTP